MNRSRSSAFAAGVVALLAVTLGGCGSKVVPSSGPRTPTESSSVQILEAPPSKYEILGVVEITENLKWGENADISAGMNALKKKAAALGANGLLLRAEGSGALATGMYNGKAFQVPIDKSPASKAMATAVYIIKP